MGNGELGISKNCPHIGRRIMLIVHQLAEAISSTPKPWRGEFVDIAPECFAAIDTDGSITIGYKGEWYTPKPMTLRVRLHNWLISIGNRKLANQDTGP